jgi:hypothetical protein
VAASETNINYTVLMMLRSKTLTAAMPKIMFCSMIDPIHVHEIPRMVYNFVLNSVSLPVFYAVSVFQREMEIPTLPLEQVVEFFTNGAYCACCINSGRDKHPDKPCSVNDGECYTKRIKDMLERMMKVRAFLPRESGKMMTFDGNCMPYLTAYGNGEDRCDMSSHTLYGKVRPSSVMRGRSKSAGRQSGHEEEEAEDTGNSKNFNEAAITEEACRMFAKQCFQVSTLHTLF